MKKISPVWFLKDPIDAEHKSYLLLDQLKLYNDEIKRNNIYATIQDLSILINDLREFKRSGNLPKSTIEKLTPNELRVLDSHRKNRGDINFKELDEVVEIMIGILYRYAKISIPLLSEYGPNIKKFEIVPEIGYAEDPEYAILFIKGLTNENLLSFIWSKKDPQILTEICNLDLNYSMSYVYLAHEVIDRTNIIEKQKTPRIFVCEINDYLENNSEIVGSMKESLISHIRKELD